MDYEDYDALGGYNVGFTVLAGLFITPLAILWFLSFCLARRKSDPARVGISWMKVVFPIWGLGLLFWVVYGALNVWDRYGRSYYSSRGYSRATLYEIMSRISIMGSLFSNLADIFLFITVVEIAGGFLLCLKGAAAPIPMRKFGRIAILAWSVVLFALVIASFGLSHDLVTRMDSMRSSAVYAAQISLTRLNGAVIIMFWLTSIPMLGFAAYVVHNTKKHELLRSPAILLLVVTILDFIRLTISMAVFIHTSLINLDRTSASQLATTPLYVSWIVAPFFDFVLMFVLLVILFSLGVKKRKGLWSQPQQQGWAYPTVAYVPTAGGVYPQGQQMQPGGGMPVQQQQQGLPAYLQVAQQQQQQGQQGQQGYYYYPQQQQQPQQVYQQQGQEQQQTAEPKPAANV